MGMFLPCLFAAFLNAGAMQIFREPIKVGNGPLMAVYMFIFTTFLLLWSVRLYPRNLKKIGKLQFIIEFLAAEFLMEHLIVDFWFPLEDYAIGSLQSLAKVLADWLSAGEWKADALIDFLKDEGNGYIVSYVMATFFLFAALHSSRICNLSTLTHEGPTSFVKEIIHSIKLAMRRIIRTLGFGKKKVKINERKNTSKSANNRQSSRKSTKSDKGDKGGDPCSLSFIGKAKKMRKSEKDSAKYNKYCPLHNPCHRLGGDGTDSCSDDFEFLGHNYNKGLGMLIKRL